ncbi:MAG: hypothetical protein AAGA70_01425 [Pseudomonadota bacterium]
MQTPIHTGVFGFFAADLTARSGTLGAAMGFHFAHNECLFCIYGFDGGSKTPLAFWVFALPEPDQADAGAVGFNPAALVDTALLLVHLVLVWLAACVAIRA